MSETATTSTQIPPLWEGLEYFDHQVEAIRWELNLEQRGYACPAFGPFKRTVRVKGGLLCDEMGAGKTITTLAVVMMNPVPLTLIAVPKAVIKNWTDNAVRAGFRVFNVIGTGPTAKWWQMYPTKATCTTTVYICGHSTLIYKSHLTEVAPVPELPISNSAAATAVSPIPGTWDRVVFDEAHVFRNHNTKLYKAVLEVLRGVKYRWMVTATPIVNRSQDAVSLLAAVGVPATTGRTWTSSYYEPLLPSLVLHRSMDTLREAVPEMPAKPLIEDMVLSFTSPQEEEYYLMLQMLTKRMERAFSQGRAAQGLELLLRLRQCSLSPELVPEEYVDKYGVGEWPHGTPSSKMMAIRWLVDQEASKKFLVFCWFHKEMDLISEMLAEHGITTEKYHGGMTEAQRNDTLDRARKPDCRVLLVQIRSGGVGLNLQEFSRVVFTSPYWTSAMMDQAIGRAVRIGQKDTVQVYHLLMSTDVGRNIDTMTVTIAESKRALGEHFFDLADGLETDEAYEEGSESNSSSSSSAPAYSSPEQLAAFRVLCIIPTTHIPTIRKAYRTQSLLWHPDKNMDNIEEATAKFKAIAAAYQLLTI